MGSSFDRKVMSSVIIIVKIEVSSRQPLGPPIFKRWKRSKTWGKRQVCYCCSFAFMLMNLFLYLLSAPFACAVSTIQPPSRGLPGRRLVIQRDPGNDSLNVMATLPWKKWHFSQPLKLLVNGCSSWKCFNLALTSSEVLEFHNAETLSPG